MLTTSERMTVLEQKMGKYEGEMGATTNHNDELRDIGCCNRLHALECCNTLSRSLSLSHTLSLALSHARTHACACANSRGSRGAGSMCGMNHEAATM